MGLDSGFFFDHTEVTRQLQCGRKPENHCSPGALLSWLVFHTFGLTDHVTAYTTQQQVDIISGSLVDLCNPLVSI